MPRQRIGIAVVAHAGRFLVGRRSTDVPLGLRAEFPGGKCTGDEKFQDCAVRECLEETGLSVVAERLLLSRRFEYPHASVELEFWLCRPTEPAQVAARHQGFYWLAAGELNVDEFPEANRPLIERLRAGAC